MAGLSNGNPSGGAVASGLAADQLLPLIYDDLRRLAVARLAQERPGQTLQPTALVHDAYLRLVDRTNPQAWQNRAHFFAAAAEAMRRIVVEQARRRRSIKRGGGQERVPLDEAEIAVQEIEKTDILALSEALDRLEANDPEAARLVKLRWFVGMTMDEAAEAMDVSPRHAYNVWAYAKVFLHRELHG